MGNFENIVVFIRLQVHLYKIGFIQNIESHLYLNQLQQQPLCIAVPSVRYLHVT
jgi:hypothetical protein